MVQRRRLDAPERLERRLAVVVSLVHKAEDGEAALRMGHDAPRVLGGVDRRVLVDALPHEAALVCVELVPEPRAEGRKDADADHLAHAQLLADVVLELWVLVREHLGEGHQLADVQQALAERRKHSLEGERAPGCHHRVRLHQGPSHGAVVGRRRGVHRVPQEEVTDLLGHVGDGVVHVVVETVVDAELALEELPRIARDHHRPRVYLLLLLWPHARREAGRRGRGYVGATGRLAPRSLLPRLAAGSLLDRERGAS
mmetsp:Transcript_106121/g.307040  ORF Transcript_106121/g.307040 Transcript_106121/m.307040 type:complete len:256 (-) Transcript_106121:227-994(-)